MQYRRQFLKLNARLLAGLGLVTSPLFAGLRWVYAQTKRMVVPKGSPRDDLINKDPRSLDASALELTPLEKFDTMGLTDHEVNLDTWRLEIGGRVQQPLALTYSELLALPPIERKVLLVCPGVFVNQGLWKGISMQALLARIDAQEDATHVAFTGPDGTFAKREVFSLDEVLAEKVFLAYGVNGQSLPKKHGFPLRIVADDHYGGTWVKYVYKMELTID